MELQFTSGPNLPHNTLSCALSSVAPPLMISELEDNEGLIMCLISHAGPNGSLTHLDKVSLLIDHVILFSSPVSKSTEKIVR